MLRLHITDNWQLLQLASSKNYNLTNWTPIGQRPDKKLLVLHNEGKVNLAECLLDRLRFTSGQKGSCKLISWPEGEYKLCSFRLRSLDSLGTINLNWSNITDIHWSIIPLLVYMGSSHHKIQLIKTINFCAFCHN